MVWVFKWKWLNHTFNSTRHCSPTRYCNGSLDHLNERSNGTGAKLATTFMWFWGFVCLTFPRQTFSAFCKIFHGVYFNHVHLPPALLFRVSALELQVVLYLFAAPMCQWRSLRVVSCESSGNDSDHNFICPLHLEKRHDRASLVIFDCLWEEYIFHICHYCGALLNQTMKRSIVKIHQGVPTGSERQDYRR